CVSPGAVETDFVAGRGHDQLVKLAEATPLKRVVQPEDVARAIMACVLYLKTSTSVKIVFDGGRSLVETWQQTKRTIRRAAALSRAPTATPNSPYRTCLTACSGAGAVMSPGESGLRSAIPFSMWRALPISAAVPPQPRPRARSHGSTT